MAVLSNVYGYQLENNDWLPATAALPERYVYITEDNGDLILVDAVDEDGFHYMENIAPFDMVQIIVSFEDNPD